MVHAIADATRRWVLGTVIVALAGAGAACQNSPEISDGLTVPLGETGSRLGQALESRVAHLDGVHAREIRSLYETRRYELIWVDEGGFTRQGRALLDFLLGKDPVPSTHFLEQHLLEIERLAEAALGTPTAPSEIQAEALAELEVAVSRAAFRYADHMTSGQLRPKAVSEQWFIRDVTPDLVTYLAEAVHSQDIAQAFVELAERHQGYGALRDALLNYRSLLEQGGWPRVPDVETLELGSRGAAVAALRRRLEIEGDLPPTSSQRPIFDGDAESAVKRFQRRHGLTPDGVAGDATLAELNVSADERVRQLELNLEEGDGCRKTSARSTCW